MKNKHDVGKVEHFYRKILHILELVIAAVNERDIHIGNLPPQSALT